MDRVDRGGSWCKLPGTQPPRAYGNASGRHRVDGHLKPDIDELKSYLIGSQLHIYDAMKAELPRKDIQPTLVVAETKT